MIQKSGNRQQNVNTMYMTVTLLSDNKKKNRINYLRLHDDTEGG